ncbi:hypothetical protein LO762_02325 [Actinocorallia sp. API 0066]|uniref:hypothetical protein n=1 Tax=Actinocorallia sp. API 0066 TaxID=2896846 RepID=UPI001E3FEB32|nr:hypothetical protein [Actinocorallia sp. API 0066]MCD0448037.1 hypothetical protein [Actinocorallia sp. API 0066]
MDEHLLWTARPGTAGDLIDAGTDPSAARVRALLARGPVKVRLAGTGSGPLAAAAVYAWLGVSAFVSELPPAELRQVLDMVAAMRGVRQPAVSRRALA